MGLKISKPSFLPRKEINPKPSILLPEDIIEEILSRLPAKSLLQFRCVSKSWRSLIGKKLFIKNHLQNITKIKTYAHWKVIYNCTEHGLKQCSLQSYYYYEPFVDLYPIDDPENNHLKTDVVVLGHCNGVLCILKQQDCLFLWNPTTRISIELPRIELSVTTKYGFGWDEGNDAYKVFVVGSDQGQNIGKVYSTNTNSWKTVEHGGLSLYGEHGNYGTFASGKIHWLKEGGLHIETFDLNCEEFGVMDNPCKPEVGEFMWLYKDIDGCLCVACKSTKYNEPHCRLRVMKQYGVKDESLVERISTNDKKKKNKSWVEKISTKENNFFCCKDYCYYIESLVSPVCATRQEIEQEQIRTSVAKGGPKRQNKRKEIEQEQVHTSVDEGRPKRQNRRRPARYDT